MIYIYSDGSSTGRADGPFGWGYVVVEDGKVLDASGGGGPIGTNNMGELEGAIQGFCFLLNNNILREVTLISDSRYVIGTADGTNTPQKNIDQCKLLRRLFSFFDKQCGAQCEWVKGHSGNIYNEMADKLAKSGKEAYTTIKAKRKAVK